MGADEAGTAKLVRERREAATPIVRAFGGRLAKTTGDGVLLEFPSVVAAVECAIAIQKMMAERNAALPEAKRILYRVGVNLGDILIEGDDILGGPPAFLSRHPFRSGLLAALCRRRCHPVRISKRVRLRELLGRDLAAGRDRGEGRR
jgi:hypothetical protein